MKRRIQPGQTVWAALWAATVLFSTGSASADAFTLNAAPAFNLAGATGTIDPVDPNDPNLDVSAITCLDGVCNPATQDWMVFTVTVTAGALDEINSAALFASSVGMGYFNLTPGEAPDAGDRTSDPTSPLFRFHVGADGGLTGTSVAVFAAYTLGSLPSNFGPGITNLTVSPVGEAAREFKAVVTTPVNLVMPVAAAPEAPHPFPTRQALVESRFRWAILTREVGVAS